MVCSLFTNILFVVGKIAASSGHAAWVSGELSRARVFRMRAQSDAVIVGGNTVRRDSMLSLNLSPLRLCRFAEDASNVNMASLEPPFWNAIS